MLALLMQTAIHTRTAPSMQIASQFGNKMWYTGVGLQDLVRRSCVGLHRRLSLVCDGVEVPLPPDAEGLVLLNIGCHMVRVKAGIGIVTSAWSS